MNALIKKIIFFGTPEFSGQILSDLFSQNLFISAVVTQPDKPRGRSQKVSYSPVKEVALKKSPNCKIFQPIKASDPQFIEEIRKLDPDLFIVVGYGQILKEELLSIPKIGPINIHTSTLPSYRGAAPTRRALMAGETKTGVTIMKMDKGMDTGPILAHQEIEIPISMTWGELEDKMAKIATPLLLKTIQKYSIALDGVEQDHKQATYAKKLDPMECEISWNFDAQTIHNQIRALSPKPSAWCWIYINGEKKRCKILRSLPKDESGAPAEILSQNKHLIVATKKGSIEILELQLEGKAPLFAPAFLNGFSGKISFQ